MKPKIFPIVLRWVQPQRAFLHFSNTPKREVLVLESARHAPPATGKRQIPWGTSGEHQKVAVGVHAESLKVCVSASLDSAQKRRRVQRGDIQASQARARDGVQRYP